MKDQISRALAAAAIVIAALATVSAASAAGPMTTPRFGSSTRKAIMNAVRGPVQRELHQPVIFKVDELRVKDGWAFILATALKPDGAPAHNPRLEISDTVVSLLRYRGGRWRVTTYDIGARDVFYVNWDRQYGCPLAILGPAAHYARYGTQ